MTFPFRTAVGFSVIALIVVASLWLLPIVGPTSPIEQTPLDSGNVAPISNSIRSGTLPRPPVTASSTIKALAKTKGFQALVSYTDSGFEPRTVTIKAGQSIRFTNNSSHPLRVARTQVAAAETTDCQPGSFDSCAALKPQEFWEFIFAKPGVVRFENVSDPTKTGTINVK